MKMKRLKLLILPALLLVGCNKNNNDSLPNPSGGGNNPSGGGSSPSTPADYFDGYDNASSHNRIKEIADHNDGFTVFFDVFYKENNTVKIMNSLTLGRKGNKAWASNTLSVLDPNPTGLDLPYTVKGAVEYKDEAEQSIDVYYADNTDQYTYYGTAYNEDIGFAIEDIESYFSLSDSLFIALMMQQTARLVMKANRRCFFFEMDNMDFYGNYMSNSHVEIGFDTETRLILYYNYWSLSFDSHGYPIVNMTVLEVNAFNFAINPPTLVK